MRSRRERPPGPFWPGPADDRDDEREAAAHELLARFRPSAQLERRRLRALTLLPRLAAVLAVLGTVVSVLVLWPGAAAPGRRDVALTAAGLAVALVVAATLTAWRTGLLAGVWRSPLEVLTREQRNALGAQLAGARPLADGQAGLVRELAVRQVARAQLPLVYLALMDLRAASALDEGGVRWAHALWAPVFTAVVVAVGRQARSAARFLAAHPATAGA